MRLTADFSGAIKKMNSALCIPKAVKLQGQRWIAETRKDLQRSASQMQKSIGPLHKKTSHLQRNIGQSIATSGTGWTMGVGTGLGGAQTVKYAKIQDEGGVTHPIVTDRMRRWAWYAFGVEQGAQRKALRGVLPGLSRSQNKATARMASSKYLGIALTKKARLDVKIPASKWFTSVIEQREPILHEYLDPEVVYNIASQMRGGNG